MQSRSAIVPRLLVSRPSCDASCAQPGSACLFQVAWSINPHMQVGAVDPRKAVWQHDTFVAALERAGAEVTYVPFVHAAYDSVFAKDNAVIVQRSEGDHAALLALPRHAERVAEQDARAAAYRAEGMEVVRATRHLEGGDIVMMPHGGAFLGFGFRSDVRAAAELERFLDHDVTCLELHDPRLYHLDMVLSVLSDGTALACLDALTPESRRRLARHRKVRRIIDVPLSEALRFGVNLVQVLDTIVWGAEAPQTTAALTQLGYRVRHVPLGQFHLAGGSAACLVSRVHSLAASAEELSPQSTAA
ncbi:MAG: ykgA [Labilithrix sp.]|nr:ykgA [Labilithrix sp.]